MWVSVISLAACSTLHRRGNCQWGKLIPIQRRITAARCRIHCACSWELGEGFSTGVWLMTATGWTSHTQNEEEEEPKWAAHCNSAFEILQCCLCHCDLDLQMLCMTTEHPRSAVIMNMFNTKYLRVKSDDMLSGKEEVDVARSGRICNPCVINSPGSTFYVSFPAA